MNIKKKGEQMVSREHKKASSSLHEKLQLLRSITNSDSMDKTSIIMDASKYIEELKEKVEILNQDTATAQSSIHQNAFPVQVKVETIEKGILVNVFSKKSCPGLLVSILEAFEELGLNVLEARVSCTDTFSLQAVGGGENEEQGNAIDAQVVKQALLQVVRKWRESNEQE